MNPSQGLCKPLRVSESHVGLQVAPTPLLGGQKRKLFIIIIINVIIMQFELLLKVQ